MLRARNILIFLLVMPKSWASPNIEYAENFSIEERVGYRLVTVSNAWRGVGDRQFAYALVPRVAEIPRSIKEDAVIIRTPVQKVVTLGTVYHAALDELGLLDSLVGIGFLNLTSNKGILQRVSQKSITPLQTGNLLDIERFLLLQPDLIFTSSLGTPEFDGYAKLVRAKQPVALTAGYMERHPLARAEWIKFIAVFYEKDLEAAVIFEEVKSEYNRLRVLASSVENRPKVFANAPFAGQWHIPGGHSFTSTMFREAGARYLWEDDLTAGGVPLDFERVFVKAHDADFWIHPGQWRTKTELLSVDERFGKFDAFRNDRVYNSTRLMNDGGGNEIWERGVLHPEEQLADLIKIFHPELLPDHEFVYYEKIR